MVKDRTNINITHKLIQRVRVSGVSNFSAYVTELINRDLRGLQKMGKREEHRQAKLNERLESVRKEWYAYTRKESLKGNPKFPKEIYDIPFPGG